MMVAECSIVWVWFWQGVFTGWSEITCGQELCSGSRWCQEELIAPALHQRLLIPVNVGSRCCEEFHPPCPRQDFPPRHSHAWMGMGVFTEQSYGSIAGQACRYLGVGVGQEAFNVLNLSKDIANCLARTRSLCQPCTARLRKADRNKGVCWFVSVIQADFRSVFLASPFPLTSSKAVIRRALCAGDGGWHR